MTGLQIPHREVLPLGEDVGHLHWVVARAMHAGIIDGDDLRCVQDTIEYLWHARVNPHVIVWPEVDDE